MAHTRRVLGLTRPFSVALLALLGHFGQERSAKAEEPKVDYADGLKACRVFRANNERELAAWSKAQPAIPYAYPREDNIGGAPWGPVTKGFGGSLEILVASIVPHIGAQLRAETPAAMISLPWSLPLGPVSTCARRQGTFTVREFRSHRAMLEPGVVSGTRGVGFFTRPAYRFIYHPSDWVVGVGAGLGSTLEIKGNREPLRPSLSPEAVMQFGHCCEAGYFTLAFRYDRFFAGEARNILSGSLGYTFF